MQLPAYSPVVPTEVMRALVDVFREGPETARERLTEYLSMRFRASEVVLTGSGTQALQLALSAAAGTARPGGTRSLVALPAYSCYDVVTAAVGAGVRATFYDIDPVTLTPEPESFKAALRQGAEVVVAGNLYGFPLDWDWLRAECSATGAVLIEDAAQGLGSGWRDQSFGSFGDYSILSFGRGKGWTAGSGGALLVREGRVGGTIPVTRPKRLGAPPWIALWILWLIGRPALFRLPTLVPGLGLGETLYREPTEVEEMPPLVAALAYRLAEAAGQAVGTRREWASRWSRLGDDHGCEDPAWTACRPLDAGACGYLRFPACLGSGPDRERLLLWGRQYGVAPGYPVPLTALPQSRALAAGPDVEAAGAQFLARSLVTLPTHPRMAMQDFRALSEELA